MFRKVSTSLKKYKDIYYIQGRVELFGQVFHFYLYAPPGLMVDSGPPCASEAAFQLAQAVRPSGIFLTHHHEDHSGNIKSLAEATGASVYMGEQTKAELKKGFDLPFYRKAMWGNPHSFFDGEAADKHLQIDSKTFEVIYTPGHSFDHYVLYDPDTTHLYTGDLFLGTHLKYGMKEESVPDMIASLEKVLALKVGNVFCGHAGIVPKGREALEKKKEFLEWLQEETLYYHYQGLSSKEITRLLFHKGKTKSVLTTGDFSPRHLVNSILSAKQL
ncbi:MBL fold metallo-hydrolase [Thalassorhabdus alkalitolerans]|uniref:MBL fold metallo-hydrolase n=1 Tax=Thalassorhabdus alkalitolerans TaxID=2282697 RepID=A0ABW0YMF0_9BACI